MSELHVTKITSIGAVEDGDNPEAVIQLFKRKDMSTISDDNADSVADMEKTDDMDRPTVEGLTEDQVKIFTEAFDAYDTQLESLQKQVDELTPKDPEDIIKDAPEEVRKALEDLRKQSEETAEELRKEREARLVREYSDLAKSIDVDSEAAAAHLMEIGEKVSEAAMKWAVEQLATAAKVTKASGLFDEKGKADAGDPVTKIDSLAKEVMSQNSDLTIQQARVLVRKNHPELRDAEREAR